MCCHPDEYRRRRRKAKSYLALLQLNWNAFDCVRIKNLPDAGPSHVITFFLSSSSTRLTIVNPFLDSWRRMKKKSFLFVKKTFSKPPPNRLKKCVYKKLNIVKWIMLQAGATIAPSTVIVFWNCNFLLFFRYLSPRLFCFRSPDLTPRVSLNFQLATTDTPLIKKVKCYLIVAN